MKLQTRWVFVVLCVAGAIAGCAADASFGDSGPGRDSSSDATRDSAALDTLIPPTDTPTPMDVTNNPSDSGIPEDVSSSIDVLVVDDRPMIGDTGTVVDVVSDTGVADTRVDPRCGDGTCNGTESSATCCRDCPCAAGSMCDLAMNRCVATPRCGDGTCNGTESSATCCRDCPCAAGSMCDLAMNRCVATPRCGDGMCNGTESSATCCRDCPCAAGSMCDLATNRCVATPRCGDGTCNGTESSATCCRDCPCAAGSMCDLATNRCVATPRCGDGMCNGTESSATCCQDCACPSGQSCSGGRCVCSSGVLRITSALRDQPGTCIVGGSAVPYTQRAAAYVVTGGTTFYIPQGGFVDLTRSIPTTLTGTQQCCLLDPCLGNLTCQTPSGPQRCLCLAARPWSATVNTCSVSSVVCM